MGDGDPPGRTAAEEAQIELLGGGPDSGPSTLPPEPVYCRREWPARTLSGSTGRRDSRA